LACTSLYSLFSAITSDADGIVPSELEKVLRTWDTNKKFPKLLYLIPTGQNPSGSTLSSDRRFEVYRIASEFNLLILEDDPYWNLRFSSSSSSYSPLKSFLSMDVDGRVIRFDSFSKIISSGLRIGWATGPIPLLEKIQLHQQAGSMHPSGLSQAVVHSLFQHWGWDGWDNHVKKVQQFYQDRRDRFAEMAQRHLIGLAEWSVPTAGMFLW
jgi:kynurenine/2-aminoadipate aminotransferase